MKKVIILFTTIALLFCISCEKPEQIWYEDITLYSANLTATGSTINAISDQGNKYSIEGDSSAIHIEFPMKVTCIVSDKGTAVIEWR